jgi:hypothetical protein
VTGRIAQFGRGIIADVSSRLTERFVDNLEKQVLAPPTEPQAVAEAPAEPPPPPPATEPLDLAAVGAVPVLKRVGPVLALALAVFLVLRWRSR